MKANQTDNNFPKKILFNGLGGAGQRHLRLFTEKLPGVITVGARSKGKTPVLNPDFTIKKEADLETLYGITLYRSIDEAYKTNPDLVVISTPTSLHSKNIIQAAEKGINIFVEKPAAANSKEAVQIISAIKQNGVSFFTSYQRRFHPLIIKTKELIDNHVIGDVSSIDVTVASYVPDWHPYEDFRGLYACKKSLGGGVIRTEIHELDFINWVFGPPKSISATGGCKGPFQLDVEDTADLKLSYENFDAKIHLCFMEKTQQRVLNIQGKKGFLEVDLNQNILTLTNSSTKQIKEYTDSLDMDGMFRNQLDFYLNEFNLSDKTYLNALKLNMNLVSKSLEDLNIPLR